MTQIFEIANLLFVWFVLIFFLKTPFFNSIQNYISGEKNRRSLLEDLFLTAKKRGGEITQLKNESQVLFSFVTNNTPTSGFDKFTELNSPLKIETIQKISLESYLNAIL